MLGQFSRELRIAKFALAHSGTRRIGIQFPLEFKIPNQKRSVAVHRLGIGNNLFFNDRSGRGSASCQDEQQKGAKKRQQRTPEE
jgi:hypothetical protein